MVCLVVNAISVKEGGALVVLRELVNGICHCRPEWSVHVMASTQAADSLVPGGKLSIHTFPKVESSFRRTRWWYETELVRHLHQWKADLLFSQTNYLPFRRTPCPTLLLEQHAGHFSPVYDRLMKNSLGFAGRIGWSLKGHWVRSSVRAANALTVQTQALAKEIVVRTGVRYENVRVIPHGTGQADVQNSPVAPPTAGQPIRIGYTTKFGVQKNFDVLFDAVARLRSGGKDVRLILTLAPDRVENHPVLESARRRGILEIVENHGEIDSTKLARLYRSLHVFVFPSLCESFGFPLVEAMANGIPVLVADTESNREVAGDAAVTFPNHDAEVLRQQVLKLADDANWFRERAEASMRRTADFSWEKSIAMNVALIEELVGQQKGNGSI